jgi:hypothetical protein
VPKTKSAKAVTKAVKAIVKSTLHAEAEKKMCRAAQTNLAVPIQTHVGGGQLDLAALIPRVEQGTGASERVGDWVQGTQLRVRGTVAWNPATVYGRAGSEMVVRVALLRSKKSARDLRGLPAGCLLTLDGDYMTDWTVPGLYNAVLYSHMPYSEYFTVVKSMDLKFNSSTYDQPSQATSPSTINPGGGAKTFSFNINNLGKYMFSEPQAGASNETTQNGGYYLHMVAYHPDGVTAATGDELVYSLSSNFSFTDV